MTLPHPKLSGQYGAEGQQDPVCTQCLKFLHVVLSILVASDCSSVSARHAGEVSMLLAVQFICTFCAALFAGAALYINVSESSTHELGDECWGKAMGSEL